MGIYPLPDIRCNAIITAIEKKIVPDTQFETQKERESSAFTPNPSLLGAKIGRLAAYYLIYKAQRPPDSGEFFAGPTLGSPLAQSLRGRRVRRVPLFQVKTEFLVILLTECAFYNLSLQNISRIKV